MKDLVISNEIPDIYYKIKNILDVDWEDGIIICDGWSLHCRDKIPPEKIVHELVHCKQQDKMGKALWWDLYLADSAFRLDQEVEAYRAEYKFIMENVSDKNQRFEYLYELSRILSSKQYGSIISASEAMRLIQSNKK